MSSKSNGSWKVVITTIIIGFIVAMCFISPRAGAQAQPRSVAALPEGLDTSRYPIFHQVEPMSAVRMADLGLRPVRLDTAIAVFNWVEREKRFHLDRLPAGVIIAVDSAGVPLYRQDCSNRLVVPVRHVLTLGQTLPDTSANALVAAAELAGESWLDRAAAWLWDFLKFLGFLALVLLAIALLTALLAAIWELFQNWRAGTLFVVPSRERRRGDDRRQGDRRRGNRRQNGERRRPVRPAVVRDDE